MNRRSFLRRTGAAAAARRSGIGQRLRPNPKIRSGARFRLRHGHCAATARRHPRLAADAARGGAISADDGRHVSPRRRHRGDDRNQRRTSPTFSAAMGRRDRAGADAGRAASRPRITPSNLDCARPSPPPPDLSAFTFSQTDPPHPDRRHRPDDRRRRSPKAPATDLDKARAIYDWIVDNTFRDPKVRGCGTRRHPLHARDRQPRRQVRRPECAVRRPAPRGRHSRARRLRHPRRASRELGYKSLGAAADDITKAQHCRAEVYLDRLRLGARRSRRRPQGRARRTAGQSGRSTTSS